MSDRGPFVGVGSLSVSSKTSVSVPATSYEDLSTYTKTDAGDYLTVASTKATVASVINQDLTLLEKDFGAGYFTDFEIHFKFYVASTDNDNQAHFGLICATNSTGVGFRDLVGGSYCCVTLSGGAHYDLNVGEDNVSASHMEFDFDTAYYVKFIRAGELRTLFVYSDEAMTLLVQTYSEGYGDGSTDTTYRYLNIAQSYGSSAGSYDLAAVSGYIDNIEIISH
jgi:hypothetical protein